MKIKDVCLGITDGSHNPPQGVENSNYLMLSSKNIFDDEITFDSPRYLTQIDFEQENKRSKVKSGDVLLTIVGTVGRVAVVDEKMPQFTLQRSVAVLHPNKDICSSRYLMYALRGKRMYIESRAKGVAQKGIYLKEVADIELQVPEISEQNAIVEVLDKSALIMKFYQQQLQKLDELVKARFIELFGDQTANPYAWQQTSIGACCTLKSGTSLPADKENEGGAIPYVKVGDMNYPGNEQYITTSSRFVSEQTAGTGVFPVGTVVFPKRGGAIGTNKKRLTRLPICADLNVMGVTAGKRLTPQNLMAYFNTVDLGTLNNGSSVPQINNKDIAPLLICIPPMALQEQFAAFVEQTDKSKVVVQKALDEAQTLFDSLMQKYFQ